MQQSPTQKLVHFLSKLSQEIQIKHFSNIEELMLAAGHNKYQRNVLKMMGSCNVFVPINAIAPTDDAVIDNTYKLQVKRLQMHNSY